MLGINSKKKVKTERQFYMNNYERNQLGEQFESNYIRTTKYSRFSFLPLALLYQFKRGANVYFLLQAILNSIALISAMNPITAWLPLGFVLGVSMIREAVEDYARYKSDVSTNKQTIKFISKGVLGIGESKDV